MRATLALTLFLLSQCVLPQSLMLQNVRADEAHKKTVETNPDKLAGPKLNGVRLAAGPVAPKKEKSEKAGPSDELRVPNNYVATVPLDLSDEYVPTQQEVSGQGAMCGGLAPAAPAEPQDVEDEVDETLRKEGFEQGLKTKFPTPDEAQAMANRGAATAALVAAARRLEEGKKKVRKARKQNRDFALAMLKWNASDFAGADKTLRAYVDEFDDSPWTPEALIHLADLAKFNGQLNEAEEGYKKVLAMTSDDSSEMSYEAHLKAYERWADLYLLEGRFGEARPMLDNIVHNDVHWRRRTWALYWTMQLNALNAGRASSKLQLADLDCGTQALAALLVDLGRSQEARRVAALDPKSARGFSLAELKTIARREKIEMVGFRATTEALTQMPLPAILHYSPPARARAENAKVSRNSTTAYGHYVVARAYDAKRGLWSVLNPQTGTNVTLNAKQLAAEWSGAGLMLAKQPSKNAMSPSQERSRWLALWPRTEFGGKTIAIAVANVSETLVPARPDLTKVARLSADEMRRIVGTCYVVHANSQNGERSFKVPARTPCGSHGEPTVSIDPVDQNIFISDTPIWYNPAKGPKVEFAMSYNSLLASNYNGTVGNKWTHNYGSFLTEMPNQITVFGGDGSQDVYTYNNGGYTAPNGVYNRLVKTGVHTYYLESQGGDREYYGIPAGQSSTVPMLLEQRDRWGQSLTIQYQLYGGKLVPQTLTDADGKITDFTYSNGRLYSIRVPDNRRAYFFYDGNGNLTGCQDVAGQTFTYSYDNMVILTQIGTPQGLWKFVSEIQPYTGGNNGYNRVKIYDPMDTNLSSPMVIQYDNVVHGTPHYTSTDHRGKTTTFGVQSIGGIGVVNGMATPEGYTQTMTFNAADPYQPVTTQEPYTNSTLQYNPQGNLTKVVSQITGYYITRTLNINRDSLGLDATSANASALQNDVGYYQGLGSASYNTNHQPLQMFDAANNKTTFSYTAWGAPSTVTTYDGNVQQDQITYYYGTQPGPNLNRLTGVNLDGAFQASYTYDLSGRVASMTDARGVVVSYQYNDLDNVTRVSYPDNTSETIAYNCCSLPSQVTDRSGRSTYYGYDNLKRLVGVQDADGKTLQFGYDKEGNQTSLLDARGALTQWQYDGDGRATLKTYADGSTEQWNYNGWNGFLLSSVNARNQTTTYGYTSWSEVSIINYPTTTDVTLNRDGLGRLIRMNDGIGETKWSYDSAGRFSKEDGPWYGDDVQHYYNSRNDISRTEVGSSTGVDAVNYGYDAIGRLSQVSASTGKWGNITGVRGGTWDTTYAGSSQMPLTSTAPNGMVNEWNYEGVGSLQRLVDVNNKLSASGAVASRFSYGYNATPTTPNPVDARNGVGKQYGNNVAEKQNQTFSYNATSMLTIENAQTAGNAATPQFYKTYGYDAMGNRTSYSSYFDNQLTATSTYNNLNQITQTSTSANRVTNYSHDADGNMTAATTSTPGLSLPPIGATYSYDEENRLVAITGLPASQLTQVPAYKYEFYYDGLSRLRISRYYTRDANNVLVLQNQTHRVYDGMDIVQERNQNNTVNASVTRVGNIGGILARTTNAGSVFYGYDGSGNVTTLTHTSGVEVGSYTYDAWGNTVATSGVAVSENPYRFATKEAIGGLYSYGLRFYSPGLGRWINRDPIGEAGGANLYGFAGNDPVNSGDAYGLAKVEVRFKSLGIGNHAYIIVSDNDGDNPYIIRFGGKGGSGGSASSNASGGSSSQSSGSRPYGSGGSSNNSSNSSNSSSAGSSRGGPGKDCGRWGPIEPFFGPYTATQKDGSETPDYTDGTDPSITIVAGDNKPASHYERLFRGKAMEIGSAMVPYNPVTTNSNAAVSSVLSRTGLGTKMTKTPVWAPGWSTNLPNK